MLPFIRMVKMRERTEWSRVGRNLEFNLVYVRIDMSGRCLAFHQEMPKSGAIYREMVF